MRKVLVLPLVAFGAAALISGYFLVRATFLSSAASWSPTTAHVVKARSTESVGYRGRRRTDFELAYEYEFNGDQYVGTNIAVIPIQIESEMARWRDLLCDRLQTGQAIQCFVNPSNPSEAVLTTTIGAGNTRRLAAYFSLSLAALLAMLFYRRSARQKRRIGNAGEGESG